MLMITFTLLIQPGIACSCKAALGIPRLYLGGFQSHQHVQYMFVESLSTDALYLAATIPALMVKIMLVEGVLPRPPSSLHHFWNGNTIHGSAVKEVLLVECALN